MDKLRDKVSDPHLMRGVSGWLLVFFIFWTFFCLPGAPGVTLAEKVWYVSLVSHIALVLALLSWWQSTRVEVRQDEDSDVQDVEEKVDELQQKL